MGKRPRAAGLRPPLGGRLGYRYCGDAALRYDARHDNSTTRNGDLALKQFRFRLIVAVLLLAFPMTNSRADSLDQIRQRGIIRWGGDQEGGAPYIMPGTSETRPSGFEGDLMEAFAKQLGVVPEFKQCDWASLGDLLRSGGADIIINGIELRSDRLQSAICTIPYYVNDLQLLGRKDDTRLTGWSDLKAKPGGGKWRIGVLQDTAAEKFLQENYPAEVEVVPYPGTTQAMDHVRDKQLDATLTDLMAAVTYRDRYPALRPVGEPVGRGYFVIYLRPGDERLRDELNDVIRELLADRRLKTLYQKYNLWNDAQETLATPEVQKLPETMRPGEPPARGLGVMRRAFTQLLPAAWMTVKLSVLSMPLAILIGLLVAVGRLYGPLPLRLPLTTYVEVIRGTPLLLQLLVIFYLIPSAITLPAWLTPHYPYVAGILGLAINYSAYEAEIYRAGLMAIPHGQMEAALALGMSRRQSLWFVIVPQAVRLVVPPVTNDFIALFKDTSVCSFITIVELSKQYSILANNTGAVLEVAAATALLYLLMSYPLAHLSRRLEHRRPPIHV